MKTSGLSKIHLFFSSLFICLLHLPFTFAKSKAIMEPMGANNAVHSAIADVVNTSSPKVHSFELGVYDSLKLGSLGLARNVFEYAVTGFNYMKQTGKFVNTGIISICDFSKPSSQKRLFIIDLEKRKILFNTYVAHGANSGKLFATDFSNIPESNKSSLGFYQTNATYSGKHGYSLRLTGMETGINDNAFKRDIVMHAADYVNEATIRAKGYIGRSWGCPAVPTKLHKPIIDNIKNGTCLFIYAEDQNYFRHSALFQNAVPALAYN
jgi:hypothetical protein